MFRRTGHQRQTCSPNNRCAGSSTRGTPNNIFEHPEETNKKLRNIVKCKVLRERPHHLTRNHWRRTRLHCPIRDHINTFPQPRGPTLLVYIFAGTNFCEWCFDCFLRVFLFASSIFPKKMWVFIFANSDLINNNFFYLSNKIKQKEWKRTRKRTHKFLGIIKVIKWNKRMKKTKNCHNKFAFYYKNFAGIYFCESLK